MLILQFEVSQTSDCTQFIFKDTTGIYDAVNNPGGWGTPNDDIGTLQTPTTIDITLPDGITTYQIDLATLPSSNIPADQPPNEQYFDMSYIGGTAGDKIPDGIYTFLYTVTADQGTHTQVNVQGFICQVCCCVESMFKDIKSGCDCCDKDYMRLMEASLLLQGLQCQLDCGQVNEFNNTLSALQKICKMTNCDKCK
jgi:hypothetical protein